MPHQCVRCNTFYEDGAAEILSGCNCGGKLFFYIKKAKLEKAKNIVINLSEQEKDQIEEDVFDIVGIEHKDEPVVLDIESIRIQKPGKYEIDLVTLFKGEPLIYKVGEGKYIIDLIRSFGELGKKS
jgi:predicted  nucleic acid-binding Zn-ribbon protein